ARVYYQEQSCHQKDVERHRVLVGEIRSIGIDGGAGQFVGRCRRATTRPRRTTSMVSPTATRSRYVLVSARSCPMPIQAGSAAALSGIRLRKLPSTASITAS